MSNDLVGAHQALASTTLSNPPGTLTELVHSRTGARHLHLATSTQEKAFGLFLLTPPADSRGIPHVLEHLVFEGSQRFPVRSVAKEMGERSISDYAGAMTARDKTCYVFSTRSSRDYFNLLEVYLDAVFFPLLPLASFTELVAPVNVNGAEATGGALISEMLAVRGFPQYQVRRALARHLYPELCYANDASGSPDAMADLQLRDIENFHQHYYHPSNAYFYSYGDIPLERMLETVDHHVLSRFPDRRFYHTEYRQTPFSRPRVAKETVRSARQPSVGMQVVLGWATADATDPGEVFALRALYELLAGAGGPLRRALVDSGLGVALADGGGLHDVYRQAAFVVGVKGVRDGQERAVETAVFDCLKHLLKKGIGSDRINDALSRLELSHHDVRHTPYPHGLSVFFRLLPYYHHGANLSCVLDWASQARRLLDAGAASYLGHIADRWLLENPHRVRVTFHSEPQADAAKAPNDTSADSFVRDGAAISSRVGEMSPSSSHQALPTVSIKDLPKIEAVPHHHISSLKGATYYTLPSPGLSFLEVAWSLETVPSHLRDYMTSLAQVLRASAASSAMAPDNSAGPTEISSRILILNGDQMDISAPPIVILSVSAKVLDRHRTSLGARIEHLIREPQLQPDRVDHLLQAQTGRLMSVALRNASAYAVSMACSQLTAAGAIAERLCGLSQLSVLRRLASDPTHTAEQYALAWGRLCRRPLAKLLLAADSRSQSELESIGRRLVGGLDRHALKAEPNTETDLAQTRAQGLVLTSDVGYSVKAFKTVGMSHADAPALLVLSHLLSQDGFLRQALKEKGGAYGVRVESLPKDGVFVYRSEADPNPAQAFASFDQAIHQLRRQRVHTQDFKRAILAAFREWRGLRTPIEASRIHFFDCIAGCPADAVTVFEQRLRSLNLNDVWQAADRYLSGGGVEVCIGNEQMIDSMQDLIEDVQVSVVE